MTIRWGLLSALLIFPACSSTPANPKNVISLPRQMIVKVPVANIRSRPEPHAGLYIFDPTQETQVEQGEPVMAFEEVNGWTRVECPEQIEFSHKQKWEGYPGWVKSRALTDDKTQIHQLQRLHLPNDELRARILDEARNHVGDPYLWGGRSKHDPGNSAVPTGVDCSGLVNWSFRQVGWFIPRDAHEQFMRVQMIEAADLKPGDLYFFAKESDPQKIVHVGFYVGDEMILEAPNSGGNVREMSFDKRFGRSRKKMRSGMVVEGRIVYFGSFFMEAK